MLFAFSVVFLAGCGGYEIERETDKLYMRGKVVTFEAEMYYVKCDNKNYSELEKSLFFLIEEEFLQLYKECLVTHPDGIKKEMKYEVVDSFLKKPWGFYKPFNSTIRFLVLQDEDGRKSMYLEAFLYNSGAKIS